MKTPIHIDLLCHTLPARIVSDPNPPKTMLSPSPAVMLSAPAGHCGWRVSQALRDAPWPFSSAHTARDEGVDGDDKVELPRDARRLGVRAGRADVVLEHAELGIAVVAADQVRARARRHRVVKRARQHNVGAVARVDPVVSCEWPSRILAPKGNGWP
jgi:hypothetical protein